MSHRWLMVDLTHPDTVDKYKEISAIVKTYQKDRRIISVAKSNDGKLAIVKVPNCHEPVVDFWYQNIKDHPAVLGDYNMDEHELMLVPLFQLDANWISQATEDE